MPPTRFPARLYWFRLRYWFRFRLFLFLLFLLLAAVIHTSPARAQNIIYVNDNATGTNTGTSWANAYTSLQNAIANPSTNSEIWVAAGLYYPDVGQFVTPDSQIASFQLLSGVAIYGGFAGTEGSRAARNWETNITVLSGDIDEDDDVDANGIVTDISGIVDNNSYHVVSAAGRDATAILDGFTITAGWADGTISGECGHQCGGGLDSNQSSPTLANLTFIGNGALIGGGAIFLYGGRPILTNVDFVNNGAVLYGGALYAYIESDARLDEVTFRGNSAGDDTTGEGGGGAISIYQSNPNLSNVTFDGNFAVAGGAMHLRGGVPFLGNTTFTHNYAITTGKGGAIFSDGGSPKLVNSVFEGNRAFFGGAISFKDGALSLVNVLFSGNLAAHPTDTSPGFGGGIYGDAGGTIELVNVTFSGNDAFLGPAFYTLSAGTRFVHALVWGNGDGSKRQLDIPSFLLTLVNSLVEDVNPGGTNLDGTNAANAPRFLSEVNCGADGCTDNSTTAPNEGANDDYGDLRLGGGSPLLDAGDNSRMPLDTLDLDQDGNFAEALPFDLAGLPRYAAIKSITPVVDIGAYERVNSAPTAAPGGPYTTSEGGSIQLNASASSDDGGIVAYAWDCTNDGSADANATAPTGSSCPYVDRGSYTLRLTVKDIHNLTGTATAQVTVANVAPLYSPAPNQSSVAGVAKAFNLGSFTDPGTAGSWSVTVDWGDTSTPTTFNATSTGDLPDKSHAYAAPGSYNVVVTVNDGEDNDNGGFQIIVNPALPGAPTVTAAPSQSATVGAAKNFALGSFSDGGDGPSWTVTIDWDDGSATTQFTANSSGALPNQAHTYAAAGSYDVLVTVSDGDLAASASFAVTVTEEGGQGDNESFLPSLRR